MDDTRTPRAIARRSDIFAEREGDLALRYPSGKQEGIVSLLAEQGRVLDGVALLLLDALSELYLQQFVAEGGYHQWVRVSRRQVALMALGRDGGSQYRLLGLTADRGGGAIEALATVLVQQRSTFVSFGQKVTTKVGFHIIEGYTYSDIGDDLLSVEGEDDDHHVLSVRLGELVQLWLQRGEVVTLPGGIRTLGARDAAALRLAHFILSHSPLPTRRTRSGQVRRGQERVLSAMAAAQVLGWAPSMYTQRYRARFLERLRAVVSRIDAADAERSWRVVAGTSRSWGVKIVVRPRLGLSPTKRVQRRRRSQ
jgi:hypothetical protein